MVQNFKLKRKDSENIFEIEAIQIGKEYMALCPFHADTKPSLAINQDKGIFFCHSCNVKGIVINESENNSNIEIAYDYRDENRNLIFQVVRFIGKKFKVRRPDGNGGYVWNLDGVPRVLYNLPEVIKEENKLIIIVEGEKDVETLKKLDYVSTCNFGGAGKWKEEYSKWLIGKEIVVISDNDDVGLKHAITVSESLIGKADSVKLIKQLPVGKDITEFVEKGGTQEKLKEIISNAPLFQKEFIKEPEPTLLVWEELKVGNYPVEWLVSELIEKTTVTIAYGESGSGKTWWALDLACCLTSGNKFLKIFEIPKPAKVLFVTLEDREARIQERMKELVSENNYTMFNGHLAFTGFKESFNIETPELFEKAIQNHQAEVVIVDSLQWTFGGDYIENSTDSMKLVMQFYRNLIKRFGVTIILLHHTNKGGDPKYNPLYATPRDARGSTTLINLADQRIGFKIHPYYNGIFTVNFQSKGLPQRQFGFRLIGGQNEPKKLEYVDLEELKKLKKVESENNKNKILEILENEPHKEFTTPELVKITGLSDTTVTKKLKELKKEKLIKFWDETKPFTAKIIDDTNSNVGIK